VTLKQAPCSNISEQAANDEISAKSSEENEATLVWGDFGDVFSGEGKSDSDSNAIHEPEEDEESH
jgi:hypothetical protein